MNILVLGASGYVGSSVAYALRSRGHRVTGVARSKSTAVALRARGIYPVLGDVQAPKGLTDLARKADGVVYLVRLSQAHAPDAEPKALFALLRGIEGSGKPFVLGSSAWYYGDTIGRVADESAPPDPPPIIAAQLVLEALTLDSAKRRVRCVIVRSGDMYGKGAGLPALFVRSAREYGVAKYIGDGNNHRAVVHVADTAELFVLALERARPGEVFNADDGTHFTTKQIAEAASRGADRGGQTKSIAIEEARSTYGPIADVLALDQRITSTRARAQLGWQTRMTTILDDLTHGSYTFATRPDRGV